MRCLLVCLGVFGFCGLFVLVVFVLLWVFGAVGFGFCVIVGVGCLVVGLVLVVVVLLWVFSFLGFLWCYYMGLLVGCLLVGCLFGLFVFVLFGVWVWVSCGFGVDDVLVWIVCSVLFFVYMSYYICWVWLVWVV